MANIVLLSCVKKKSPHKSKARDLYISTLFRYSLRYAEQIIKPDKICILSAKHGLLNLDKIIEPYEETLNNKKREEQRFWAKKVFAQIEKECDVKNDTFIFLTGKKYNQDLSLYLPHIQLPLKNLTQGKRVQWLKQKLEGV